MSAALIRKDSLVLGRNVTAKALLLGLLLLLAASIAAGLQREAVFDKERVAAEAVDKRVWMEQGERNPHSAAHFSRYAFRPPAPLALIDPGISDFAGSAVWMEAHYQNPAVFRRVEDTGELGRYATLSPAFLVLVAAPLLILLLLHDSVAGEREDGTLRQLLATGVSNRDFVWGKLLAAWRVTLPAFTAIFAMLALASLYQAPPAGRGDAIVRLPALFVTYAVYLAAFAAFAVGVSALFRSRQQAFLAMAGAWVILCVLLPRFAADVSVALHPQPDALETTERLHAVSATYWEDEAMQQRAQAELLAEHGIDDLSELPFNWGGYQLQYSEEVANPLFDELYAGLDRVYRQQEDVMSLFSILSPVIATSQLSTGIAGTDRHHQQDFTEATEHHRRAMIKLLNEDYMLNAGEAGSAYTGDEAVWARFDDLSFVPPPFGAVSGRYLGELALLSFWFLIALLFAVWSVRRAVSREVHAQ